MLSAGDATLRQCLERSVALRKDFASQRTAQHFPESLEWLLTACRKHRVTLEATRDLFGVGRLAAIGLERAPQALQQALWQHEAGIAEILLRKEEEATRAKTATQPTLF